MEAWLFLLAVIFLSSALQAGVGFGFSIMTVPLLLLVYDAREAVVINNVLSILLSALMFRTIRSEIDRGFLKRLLLGSILMMPAGLAAFMFMPAQHVKLAVGVLSLAFVLLFVFPFRIRPSEWKEAAAGGLSGFLTAAIGIPGPPLLAYTSAVDMDKAKTRSTTLAFYIFIYSVSFVLQIGFAPVSPKVWAASGGSVPLVIAGIVLGQWLFKRIHQRLFHRICLAVLFATGVQLVYSSLT
jgi:uncharacterized membrane protein YfcA